jgi:hypothetical protein
MKESQKPLFTFFIIVLVFVFIVPVALTKQPDDPKPEISITPASATVKVGESKQFSLQVKNGDNPSNVKWGVTGGIGKISSGGSFTAGDKIGSGSVTVSAKVNGTQLSASAQVSVIAGADKPKPELTISPSNATLKTGETQQFTLQVKNGDNPSNVKWGVTGGIGKITSEGSFTAGDKIGSGSVTVSAKVNGIQLSASANVQVTAKEKLKLELMIIAGGNILDEITLKVREQIQLSLQVKNGEGIAPPTDVEWKVTGNLGTVNPGGLLTADDKPGRGAVLVTATVNGEKLSANIKLNVAEGETPPGPTKKIKVIIDPGSVELLKNGTQTFTVIEPTLKAGDIVQWLVVPSRIGFIEGSIDNDGLFIAGQNTGKGLVVATVQSGDAAGTGKASVRVSSDITKSSPKLELKVKPEYARVNVNGSTTFEADVKGPDKNTQYSVIWELKTDDLGSIQPVIGDKVTFSAGTTLGKALITATLEVGNEIFTDWAVAEVVGEEKPNPAKLKVAISPESASLQVSEAQNFTASIVGLSVDLPVSWSWSVAPKKLGSVDPPSGNKTVSFTALEPGWGMLIVKADDSNGRSMNVGKAKIFVSGKNGQNQKITIIPQSKEVNAGGNAEFKVVDMNGIPLIGLPITWKAVPDKLGTIIGTGSTITFKAGDQAGHVLIMAKVGDGRGLGNAQARLTIRNAYGKLKAIIAGSQSPRINEPSKYEVSVTDSNVDLTGASIEWRVVPNHLGTFDGTGESVFFTPTIAGRGVIMVEVNTSQGKITGRLSITVDKK